MKRVWNYMVTMWQPALLLSGTIIALGLLFSFRIGSIVPGVAPAEVATHTDSTSLETILGNPVNAPYKVGQLVIQQFSNSLRAERLVSSVVASISVVLFFVIARRLISRYAAYAATVMYASSSALLHSGRLAMPEISVLFLFILLACGYYIRFNKHKNLAWVVTSIALGLCLYTPGIIYFVIAGTIWQFKTVRRTAQKPSKKLFALCIAITTVLIIPLIMNLVRNPHFWQVYAGLPPHMPALMEFLRRLVATPAGLIVYAPANPLYRLGHQPMLDVFAAFMFVLGCYYLVKNYTLDRLKILGGIFVITILFCALSGNYENSLVLLPFIYLVIGMGLHWMHKTWNGVFPFNPLARWLAVAVLSIAVLTSVNFQTRRYFVAWPHNALTRTVFSIK